MSGSKPGFGQLSPLVVTNDFNYLLFVIGSVLRRVRTVTLVEVVTAPYGGSGVAPVGFLDAKPIVNMLDGVGNSMPHGTVYRLPYIRLQGGANAVICDPQVGDKGVALICDRDISSVKQNRGQANPGSSRRFSLADGLYLGGVLNGTPNQYIYYTPTGIVIEDKNGNVISMQPGSIAITGNVTVTGSIIAGFGGADSVGVQTHTHNQPNDSHGDTEYATDAPNVGT